MIIGIDLGTTNSLVAFYGEKGPEIIPNRLGKRLTPSVVSIDENNQIFVGETAKERLMLYPDSGVQVFKRSMGSGKKFSLGKKEFTPEAVSSFVIRALKEDAENYLGEEINEAVISVPAYFDDARRKATKRAGELAGLKVERIISEPTAAAISYGLYQENQNTKFLVFDLGGGTFDVSILERYHNILEVHAVAGDNYLGGEDFTEVLEEMFYKKKDIDKNKLDIKTIYSIKEQAEKCKHNFMNAKTSQMACNINGKIIEYNVDLDDYEKACDMLLERIRQPIKRSLSDANTTLGEIDKVVLVGGATKLPIIRKFVGKLFKNLPDISVNPDEAVALGVAIQGAMKERNEAIKEVILTDVCPYTLGTEVVVVKENNRVEHGHFCPIIERNTIIPASRTERLYTSRDYQKKIRINVLQGESRFAANNLSLGELVIDVPKALSGEEGVDVTYTYDINSILEVMVKVVSTGKVTKAIIKGRDVELKDEEIKERMEELSYLKILPRDQEENKLLLLRGERYYEESLGEVRDLIGRELGKFEDVLNTQDPQKIASARRKFNDFLVEIDYMLY